VEWVEALTAAQSELQKCKTNPLHWYEPMANECPWCALSDRVGADSFPAAGSAPVDPTPRVVAPPPVQTLEEWSERPVHLAKRLALGAIIFILSVFAIISLINASWMTGVYQNQQTAMRLLGAAESSDPLAQTFSLSLQSAEQVIGPAQSALAVAGSEPIRYLIGPLFSRMYVIQKSILACETVKRAAGELDDVNTSVNSYVHTKLSDEQAKTVRQQLLTDCADIENDSLTARHEDPNLAGAWIVGIQAYRLAGQIDQAQSLIQEALATCSNKTAITNAASGKPVQQ
jgi:hypothetical protein